MRKNPVGFRNILALLMVMAPSLAMAHVGAGETRGVLHGLMHPLKGPDHVAAMVAVGLWAAQRGGRAFWGIPLSFVAAMLAGCALSVARIPLPLVEPGICASVVVLGLLVSASVRLPLVAGALLVGLCAIFHGHAHGAEMPETVSGLAYGIGFVLSTSLLHTAGIGLGLLGRRMTAPRFVCYAGGATALFGVYLFSV